MLFHISSEETMMRNLSGRVIAALAAVVVLVIGGVVVLAMATWDAVPPDKIMLHYTGGPFDGTHFQEVVQPGTGTSFYGLLENLYFLPATQRNYIIDKDPNTGDKGAGDVVVGVSSDNVRFEFEAAIYFKLNTDPKTIRQFFEQICLHDHCTDLSNGGGWDKMLDQYLRPQIENSVRLEAGKYTREQLYRDPDTLKAMQADVEAELKDRVNTNLGGPYFCGPDSTAVTCTDFRVVLKNPTPPQNVADAYADTAAAAQQVATAKNDADAKVQAAEGERDAQNARAASTPLSQAQIDYVLAQATLACAQNSNCTLVITPGGTGVNVNTGP
jgi:regulator of protease activity HflC (stomatin/prohibitin superfamily)